MSKCHQQIIYMKRTLWIPPSPQLQNSLFLHISSSWQDSWNKEASTIKRIHVMSTWYQQRQLIDLWTPQLFRAVVGLTWLAAKEHGVVKPFLILTKQMVEQKTVLNQNCSSRFLMMSYLNRFKFFQKYTRLKLWKRKVAEAVLRSRFKKTGNVRKSAELSLKKLKLPPPTATLLVWLNRQLWRQTYLYSST